MTIALYESILEYLAEIIRKSDFRDHVFAVGGCVRDKHLNAEIKDIDLVVDLPNGGIDFAKYLESHGYTKGSVVTYENYGTVMFKLKAFPEIELEAVQTRKEDYHDAKTRNPVTCFGTIEEDCTRRDFTINALYYNISSGEEIDFNGNSLKDLHNKVIDTCGDPDIIFNEDPLRILRAVRFAARLGYTISERTKQGIKRHKERLEIISQERITDEFNKILSGPRPEIGLEMMHILDLFPYVLPEFGNYVANELYQVVKDVHNIKVACIEDKQDSLTLILTYIARIVNPVIFRVVMHRMKYSNDDTEKVYLYATALPKAEFTNEFKSTVHLRELEYLLKTLENYTAVFTLLKAVRKRPYVWEKMWPNQEHHMLGYNLPVDGYDIMETLNIGPSMKIKEVRDDLLNDAYVNPAITKEECIERIKLRFGNKND